MTSCGFCSQPIESYFDETVQKPLVLVGECGHLFHSSAPSREKTCYKQLNDISYHHGGNTFLACVHCRTDGAQPERHARRLARRPAEHGSRGGRWPQAPRADDPPSRGRDHWERPARNEEAFARRNVVQSMHDERQREDGEIEPASKRMKRRPSPPSPRGLGGQSTAIVTTHPGGRNTSAFTTSGADHSTSCRRSSDRRDDSEKDDDSD